MSIRVISKSHENGSNEEIYLCTDENDFNKPAESFFFMNEGDSIGIDEVVDSLEAFEFLPLPTDRPLKAS